MKSTNGIPIPEKDFYDVGVAVDGWKLNKFCKAINDAGYKYELTPGYLFNTIKVLQVPKDKLDEFTKLIKRLELEVKRSN